MEPLRGTFRPCCRGEGGCSGAVRQHAASLLGCQFLSEHALCFRPVADTLRWAQGGAAGDLVCVVWRCPVACSVLCATWSGATPCTHCTCAGPWVALGPTNPFLKRIPVPGAVSGAWLVLGRLPDTCSLRRMQQQRAGEPRQPRLLQPSMCRKGTGPPRHFRGHGVCQQCALGTCAAGGLRGRLLVHL